MRRNALIAAFVLAVAACATQGGSDGEAPTTTLPVTASTAASDFPVTIIAANGGVTVEQVPQRIVSLAPTATETLFAIGAGDQVVAVDEFSNYPEDAPTTDLSGFEPNVEAVAAYDPDLVVVSDDLNDIVASLEAVQIPVAHLPAAATLDDAYAQIEQLGVITGNREQAADLIESMRGEIDELAASVPDRDQPPTYFHELDGSLFTVTSGTFIGQIYSMAGLDNIADEAPGADLYPQLSAEYVIASDPDLIFLADTKCCAESAETVAARPGWDQLTAVTSGAVTLLDDDIASRWGPRVVDFFGIIVESAKDLEASSS